MYAVIKTGGKQYKVSEGDILRVEKLAGEDGEELTLDNVLMVVDGDNVQVGSPCVDGAQVIATITSHGREAKVKIVKFKRRKHYRKQQGHRQYYTELTVKKISTTSRA